MHALTQVCPDGKKEAEECDHKDGDTGTCVTNPGSPPLSACKGFLTCEATTTTTTTTPDQKEVCSKVLQQSPSGSSVCPADKAEGAECNLTTGAKGKCQLNDGKVCATTAKPKILFDFDCVRLGGRSRVSHLPICTHLSVPTCTYLYLHTYLPAPFIRSFLRRAVFPERPLLRHLCCLCASGSQGLD